MSRAKNVSSAPWTWDAWIPGKMSKAPNASPRKRPASAAASSPSGAVPSYLTDLTKVHVDSEQVTISGYAGQPGATGQTAAAGTGPDNLHGGLGRADPGETDDCGTAEGRFRSPSPTDAKADRRWHSGKSSGDYSGHWCEHSLLRVKHPLWEPLKAPCSVEVQYNLRNHMAIPKQFGYTAAKAYILGFDCERLCHIGSTGAKDPVQVSENLIAKHAVAPGCSKRILLSKARGKLSFPIPELISKTKEFPMPILMLRLIFTDDSDNWIAVGDPVFLRLATPVQRMECPVCGELVVDADLPQHLHLHIEQMPEQIEYQGKLITEEGSEIRTLEESLASRNYYSNKESEAEVQVCKQRDCLETELFSEIQARQRGKGELLQESVAKKIAEGLLQMEVGVANELRATENALQMELGAANELRETEKAAHQRTLDLNDLLSAEKAENASLVETSSQLRMDVSKVLSWQRHSLAEIQKVEGLQTDREKEQNEARERELDLMDLLLAERINHENTTSQLQAKLSLAERLCEQEAKLETSSKLLSAEKAKNEGYVETNVQEPSALQATNSLAEMESLSIDFQALNALSENVSAFHKEMMQLKGELSVMSRVEQDSSDADDQALEDLNKNLNGLNEALVRALSEGGENASHVVITEITEQWQSKLSRAEEGHMQSNARALAEGALARALAAGSENASHIETTAQWQAKLTRAEADLNKEQKKTLSQIETNRQLQDKLSSAEILCEEGALREEKKDACVLEINELLLANQAAHADLSEKHKEACKREAYLDKLLSAEEAKLETSSKLLSAEKAKNEGYVETNVQEPSALQAANSLAEMESSSIDFQALDVLSENVSACHKEMMQLKDELSMMSRVEHDSSDVDDQALEDLNKNLNGLNEALVRAADEQNEARNLLSEEKVENVKQVENNARLLQEVALLKVRAADDKVEARNLNCLLSEEKVENVKQVENNAHLLQEAAFLKQENAELKLGNKCQWQSEGWQLQIRKCWSFLDEISEKCRTFQERVDPMQDQIRSEQQLCSELRGEINKLRNDMESPREKQQDLNQNVFSRTFMRCFGHSSKVNPYDPEAALAEKEAKLAYAETKVFLLEQQARDIRLKYSETESFHNHSKEVQQHEKFASLELTSLKNAELVPQLEHNEEVLQAELTSLKSAEMVPQPEQHEEELKAKEAKLAHAETEVLLLEQHARDITLKYSETESSHNHSKEDQQHEKLASLELTSLKNAELVPQLEHNEEVLQAELTSLKNAEMVPQPEHHEEELKAKEAKLAHAETEVLLLEQHARDITLKYSETESSHNHSKEDQQHEKLASLELTSLKNAELVPQLEHNEEVLQAELTSLKSAEMVPQLEQHEEELKAKHEEECRKLREKHSNEAEEYSKLRRLKDEEAQALAKAAARRCAAIRIKLSNEEQECSNLRAEHENKLELSIQNYASRLHEKLETEISEQQMRIGSLENASTSQNVALEEKVHVELRPQQLRSKSAALLHKYFSADPCQQLPIEKRAHSLTETMENNTAEAAIILNHTYHRCEEWIKTNTKTKQAVKQDPPTEEGLLD